MLISDPSSIPESQRTPGMLLGSWYCNKINNYHIALNVSRRNNFSNEIKINII